MLQLMGAVAQFERANILERQREGIEKAKKAGKRFGRRPSLTDGDVSEIVKRIKVGEERAVIAESYGISRQTLYSSLKRRGFMLKPVRKAVEVVSAAD